jgi:hypothetical protein
MFDIPADQTKDYISLIYLIRNSLRFRKYVPNHIPDKNEDKLTLCCVSFCAYADSIIVVSMKIAVGNSVYFILLVFNQIIPPELVSWLSIGVL